ncbi:MAG: T9SS type A sorting domain-containing protein [Flavobacterium sp.]|nr:T9SS type A sorting domain-containing protein [Flavobacterium sp.]
MKYFYKILCLTLLLAGNLSLSQVSVVISEVKLNGQSIPNGSPVQLGTSTSGILRFKLAIIKPNDLTMGSVRYSIGTYTSNGVYTFQVPQEEFYLGPGNTGTTGTYEFELFNTDLDFAGGCYLSASVQQLESPNSPPTPLLNWKSNQVSLKKSPTYTITSNTNSVQCDSTTPVTFTVNSNAPGYSTYQWSYGSGWTVSGGTTGTSLTLIPGSSILNPIGVTPTFSGVVQPLKTYTMPRSQIDPTGYISGSATVCTTRIFTFEGLLANQTVAWSLSNATAGTLSSTTGTSTTFTTTGGGAVDLIATATNGCGQSYVRTLGLFAGSPPAFSLVRASNEICDDIKYHYVPYEITNRNPAFTYTYNVATYPWVNVTQSIQTYNGVIQDVLVFPKTYSGTMDIYVTTSNSCGSTAFFVEEEPISNCSGLGFRSSNSVEQFTVFPNPANDIVTIELKDSKNQFEKDTTISGELFDLQGQSKSKVKITDNKATLSVKGLNKGIYILKININDQVESHQIAVE